MAVKTDSAEALLKQLKNPFDPKFVKWRVGATNSDKSKGIALAYIDSREVKKRLDEVCGVENWQSKLIPVENGFICEIEILIGDRWIRRSNAAGNTKVEPIKGGASDAFKRAAAQWGVGHYLYYLPNLWVGLKQQGNSYVLAETPELPKWALPGEVGNWEDIAEFEADMNSGEDVFIEDKEVESAHNSKDVEKAIQKINATNNSEELKNVWIGLSTLAANKEVFAAKEAKKMEFVS